MLILLNETLIYLAILMAFETMISVAFCRDQSLNILLALA
jgi:hypothetical protein